MPDRPTPADIQAYLATMAETVGSHRLAEFLRFVTTTPVDLESEDQPDEAKDMLRESWAVVGRERFRAILGELARDLETYLAALE